MFSLLATAHLVYFVQSLEHHYTNQLIPSDVKVYEKYGEFPTDCGPGEYLNLCGECVSGETEKEDDFGKDSCGICGGLETCKGQCSDPLDILDADDNLKSCTKLISMAPSVLDTAESAVGSICIFGDGINNETVTSVECNLSKGKEPILIEAQVLEDQIQLTFPLPSSEGIYDLYCNTSLGIEFKQQVSVVNSDKILPIEADKTALITWAENQITVNISQMVGPADLLCFAKTSSGQLLFSEWTGQVAGNSLTARVQCPSFVPVRPEEVEFGVAYSLPAVKRAKTLKLMGVAKPPKAVNGVFKLGRSEIIVTFDQNLEEAVKGCSSIFDSKTVSLFGNASSCFVSANEVHVKLRDAVMKNNATLFFKDNALKTMFSKSGSGGSVFVSTEESKAELKLEGRRRLCSGEETSLEMSSSRLTVGSPNWKIQSSSNQISPGQQQRLNLLKWREIRASRSKPNAFTINSTMLKPGVKYTVKATANDIAGTQQEVTTEVELSGSNDTWLRLDGPTSLDVREYAFFHAVIHTCGPPVHPTKYEWLVRSSTGERLDSYFINGPKLQLNPGALHPNMIYNISAQAFIGKDPIAFESVNVQTYLQDFNILLEDAKIVVGNGHSLEIDASRAIDLDSKTIKLNWICKKGYCFAPGKDKTPLNTLESFSEAVLKLQPKTLAVGRYLLGLEASSDGTKIGEAEVELLVVTGQPPYISGMVIKEDKSSFRLETKVLEIRHKCRLVWEVVPRIGYSYITVEKNSLTVEGLPTHPQSALMKLTVGKVSLTPGSKILLKALADCGRGAHSYRVFRFFVPESLHGARLEVQPPDGRALETEFVYRLVERQTPGRAMYSFGYEDGGNIRVLYSGNSKEFKTYFGCCKLKTVARVCRTKYNCLTVYGPEIVTSLSEATSLNSSISRSIADTYKGLMLSTNYEEALSNLKMFLPTLKQLDPSTYHQFSEEIQRVIVERIQIHTNRMKTDQGYLEDSVKMLDAANDVMALMSLSEDSMIAILQFRDLVHANARALSEKQNEKRVSENLPPEPRPNGDDANEVRHKRNVQNMARNSKMIVKPALTSTLQLVEGLDSPSESAHQQRLQLLDQIIFHSTTGNTNPEQIGNITEMKFPQGHPLEIIQNEKPKLLRHKRGAEDSKNTIKKMEAVLKTTVLSLKQIGNNSLKAREEKLKLVSFIVDYSTDLCNLVSTRLLVGSGQDLVLLGVIRQKTSEKKTKFPFCTSWCPSNTNFTTNVSLIYNSTNDSSKDVCLAMASLNEDILTNINTLTEIHKGSRLSTIFWLNSMRYQHQVVPKELFNISLYSEPAGEAVIQFPVWAEPKITGKKLECWQYSPAGWNNTACVKLKEISKENFTSVQCQCPFPGFYSIFAADDIKSTQGNEIANNTTNAISLSPTTKPKTTTLSDNQIATKNVEIPFITKGTLATTVVSNTKVATTAIMNLTTATSHISKANIPNSKVTTVPSSNTKGPGSGPTLQHNNISSTAVSFKNVSYYTTITNSGGNTQPPDIVRTVPSIFQPYKYSATFRINENYSEEVGEMKEKFEEHIEDQLQKNLNMSESVTVDAGNNEAKILVTLRIRENKLQETGPAIAALKDQLKNGSLVLTGLRGDRLNILPQDIILKQQGGGPKPAITAFVAIVFIFLMILIGSVVAAFYLRNTREQRSIRITQDLHPDPPAPKYLRLHDSVSLDSSGPSTPQTTEMESSLAVLTKPQRRGYETMETFSHFPGNI